MFHLDSPPLGCQFRQVDVHVLARVLPCQADKKILPAGKGARPELDRVNRGLTGVATANPLELRGAELRIGRVRQEENDIRLHLQGQLQCLKVARGSRRRFLHIGF